MTNPKLALIPSGYKATKVYSILPSDGSGDFDFDRASEGTRVRKDGLIEEVSNDVPRLDWSDGNCPSLLLEPQSTNLITYSDDFGNSDWDKGTGTITTNTSISPDGTLSADKYSAVSTSSFAFLSQTKSADASQSYTYSIWIKKVSGSGVLKLAISDVNLATLTSNNINLTNEFVRYSFSIETGDLSNTGSIGAGFINITSGDVIEVWGAQLEEGYATSYIPTQGSAVTRLFDDLESDTSYSTGNDVTWFLDFDTYTFENSFRAAMVVRNSGFTQTMDWISYNSGSDYYIRIRATNQSALQTIIAFGEDAIQMFTRNKVAVRLYGSNFEIYVNGTREYTGTSDDGDWTVLNNSAILNDFGTTSERPSTKLYDFRVYDQTMTQSELEELTTL